jgi:hypothetical protein
MTDFLKYNTLATFGRASVAINPETFASVASGTPRYVAGADGTAGGAIFIEEATTNLLTPATDVNLVNCGSTHGEVVVGSLRLTKYVEDAPAGNVVHNKDYAAFYPGDSVTVRTISFYAKALAGSTQRYACVRSTAEISCGAIFDVNNGTVTDQYPASSASIVSVDNGIYRCVFTYISTVAGGVFIGMTDSSTGISSFGYTGDGASGILMGTIQGEGKSYASTWQDPASARVADAVSGLNSGSGFSVSQGTVSVMAMVNDAIKDLSSAVRFAHVFEIPKAAGDIIGIDCHHRYNTNNWMIRSRDDANNDTSAYVSDSYTPNGPHMFTISWTTTELVLYIDGVARTTLSNPKLPTAFSTYWRLGKDAGTSFEKLRFFPRALTAEEVSDLYLNGRGRGNLYYLPFNNNLNIYSGLDLSSPPLVEPYEHGADDEQATISSPKEAGYVQTRPRFTRVTKKWHLGYPGSMTDEDQSLMEAWQTTVAYRADSFIWVHPKSGVWYTVRLASAIKFKHGISDSYWQFEFDLAEV